MPYLIITAGVTIKKKFFTRYGDFSYGMYIYAFPVQQTVAHFWAEYLTVATFFVISFIITLILSVLSWNLLEKKALQFK